ncbi:cytosolic sulfotransferase 5-like [Lolium rigidum]|uniref:cytosolic sulfotransferase 5-like n=1 Tax=Lolium rigidum TaxID=89674 RepID=UPI001F5D2DA5|nr:cytosolic sulfotransferase 5-like [Lolium rigidum]
MGGGTTAPAGVAAAEEEGVAKAVTTATPHADIPNIMSSLPTGPGFPPYQLSYYGGFWLSGLFLKGIAASHARFKPRPTDVLLTSFPKSGTTWLKALAFSALNRAAHPPSSAGHHPLYRSSPHDLVSFLEVSPELIATDYAGEDELYGELPSPRLLASHLPYSLLPNGIKIVYVCRDPKDTLVSLWHFHEKTTAVLLGVPGVAGASPPTMPTFEEAFELFCEGRCISGPHWRHALEFWEASRRRPDQVLFLRYEDMLLDPAGNLRTLAAFMGCPFSPEEEAAGVVHHVVELCSLAKLKGLEVNRSGSTLLGLKNEVFFRKGTVGDWSSCMTPAMAARLDGVVKEALKGSTLTFGPAPVIN